MTPALAIFLVFFGCGSNVIFLEFQVKEDPGVGNLITFSQFVFIAIHGFIFTSNFGRNKLKIGLKHYLFLVVMFFVTNLCNNWAFDFNIPMPLHIIFRAGSLIANLIMGIIILKKKYPISKYLSVFMITLGIILCTIESSKDLQSPTREGYKPQTDMEVYFWWTLGITLLTVALFISARMGIYQEELYSKFGKHPQEALYLTHLISLPGFLMFHNNIYEHFVFTFNSPALFLGIPKLFIYLMGNVLTQFICISSVYVLSSECSSLTVTLVVTLRKFFSLIVSIIYFQNNFTILHWIGTFLVFAGTVIFTEVVPRIRQSMEKKKSD